MRAIDTPRPSPALEAGGIAALALLAAALRALAWSRTEVLFNDGPIFVGLAQLIDAGLFWQTLAHPYHPLYPMAVAGVHAAGVSAGWEGAAVAVSVLAGTASVPLLYLLVRQIFDARIAAVAAFVLAVHPYAVAHSSDVQSDGLYLAFFLGAVALSWRAVRTVGLAAAAAAGVVAGGAYLVRPEGLGVAVFAALWALSPAMKVGVRRRLGWLVCLAAGTAVVAVPYLGVLHERHGGFVLTGKKSAARLSGFDTEGPRGAPSGWLDEARGARLEAERPFLETVVDGPRVPVVAPAALQEWRLAGLLDLARAGLAAGRPELLLLLAIGVVSRRRGAGDVFLVGLASLYGLLLAAHALEAGYVSKRHVLPVVVLGFGYVAVGGLRVAERAVRFVGRIPLATAPRAATALTLVAVATMAAPKTLDLRRDGRAALRRAAEWVRERPDRIDGVAAGKQRVAYYADAPFVPLPGPNQGPLLAYLRASGARYVIVDEQRIDSDTALRHASREGLRVLHRVQSGERRAAVFGFAERLPTARGG